MAAPGSLAPMAISTEGPVPLETMAELVDVPSAGDGLPLPPQLQQLLTNQAQHAETHRTHYLTLKSQHRLLQDQLGAAQTELTLLRAERQTAAEQYQQLLAQSRRDIQAKDQLVSELQAQIPSPQQLQYRQLQTREEVKAQMREKLIKAEEDSEVLRGELHELKYRCSCLQTDAEQLRQQHSRELQELRVKQEVQLTELQAECDKLRAYKMVSEAEVTNRLLPIQKENSALHLRLRNQSAELDEARALKHSAQTECAGVHADFERRQAELSAALQLSEAERSQLSTQGEKLRRQLAELQQQLTEAQLQAQRHDSRAGQATERLSDNERHYKRQMADLQLEVSNSRSEAEKERAAAARQIRELEHRLTLSQGHVSALEAAAAAAERDTQRRIAQARDSEWATTRQLHETLLEVENKLQEAQHENVQAVTEKSELAKQCEERLAEVYEMKMRLETELTAQQRKTKTEDDLVSELEQQRDTVSQLRQELNAEHAITVELTHQLKQMQAERQSLETQAEMAQERREKSLQELATNESAWSAQRSRLQERLQHLERCRLQAHEERDAERRKARKHAHLISKLRRRIELMQAQMQQLTTEQTALKRCVPEHTYNQLRKQHRQLQHKLCEFSSIIMSISCPERLPAGGSTDLARLSAQLQLLKARLNAMELTAGGSEPVNLWPPSPQRPPYRRSPTHITTTTPAVTTTTAAATAAAAGADIDDIG